MNRAILYGFARNTVLHAGAGTGKTEALATVYLHLVAGLAEQSVWGKLGVPPEKIVALTFTEKAAGEMHDRITGAVQLFAAEKLPTELESSQEQVRERAARQWCAGRGLGPSVVARVTALAHAAAQQNRALPTMEVWQRIGFALSQARVGTFHGFAAGVLRSAALDLGIDPAFRVLEQEEAERLLRESIVEALSQAARSDVAAVADMMAAAGALDADGEHGLVPHLLELVRRMDEIGLDERELGAAESLVAAPPHPFVAADKLRSFALECERIPALREDGTSAQVARLAELVAGLSALETPEGARACVAALAAFKLPGKNRTKRIEATAEAARRAVESLQEGALSVLSTALAEASRTVLVDTRRRYRARKRGRSSLDYADLILGVRDALRERPSLRRAWKQRVDAVLVDEFQDTNRVQRDLLFLLRERRDNEKTFAHSDRLTAYDLEPKGLLLVGDAKQSIYAFRGADVGVFLETEKELTNAGGVVLELTDSHRSLDTVLEAINPAAEALLGAGLIAHGESMYDRSRDALAAEMQGDGIVRAELLLVPSGSADAVRDAEATAIAQRIRTLVDAPAPRDTAWRVPRFDDIAVLVPSWTHADVLKQALKAQNIPYAVLGGPGFWERREVDDLVVLLRFVADPGDRMALASVLRGPLVGISDAGLAKLLARPSSLEDLLDPPAPVRLSLDPDDRERLDEARPTLRRLTRFGPTLGPEAALRLALSERHYAAVLAALPFGAQKAANVDKLVGLAAAAEQRQGEEATIPGFVRYVDRMRAAAQHETEADVSDVALGAVQVLSIHAAKGLEWPVVFVAQTSRRRRSHGERILLDGQGRVRALPAGFEAPELFRDLRRDAHGAEDDDQRRMLYVALTRARDLVIASGPQAEGEGEWVTLSRAFRSQAPLRVRVLEPAARGPSVPVRASGALWDVLPPHAEGIDRAGEYEAEAHVERRLQMSLEAESLGEFERCPRRYFARFEVGLAEVGRDEELEATMRALLSRLDLQTAAKDPAQAVRDASRVLATSALPPTVANAERCVLALLQSPLGKALVLPGAMAGKTVPFSLALQEQQEASVLLHTSVDWLLHTEHNGEEGLALVRCTTYGPESEELGLALEIARAALQQRLEEKDALVPLRALLVRVGPQAEANVRELPVPKEGIARRVLPLAERFDEAQRERRWEGVPREQCERMRCGYLSRCYGAG